MTKAKIMSITSKDCRWDYYSGTGKGGQNRNHHCKCVRCFHDPSGAMGKSEDERSLDQNKKIAFRRMAESKEFQSWITLESKKKLGLLDTLDYQIDMELVKNTKVQVKNDKGQWVDSELSIDAIDIMLGKKTI